MRPSRPACAFLLSLLLGALPGAASDPYLVKDINPVPQNAGSEPRSFFSLESGISLFFANDGELGNEELWRSDGTEAGTFLLLDEPLYVQSVVPAGRLAFLRTWPVDGSGPTGLWVTDGSAGNTVALLESPRLQILLWVPDRGLLFFLADDGTHGFELWRTDGTPAGTRMVKDLVPGSGSPAIGELPAVFQGRLFFRADDGVNGPALWASDGTAAGTRMVRDPWRGRADHAGPSVLRVIGSKLLFFAPAPGIGTELWASDGTPRGTQPVTDLVPGPASPRLFDVSPFAGRMYLLLDAGRGQEIWVTNGTRAGTRALTDFALPSPFGEAPFLSRQLFHGRLPFRANDGVHGTELWMTDGTRAGTRLVRDLCPGSCSSGEGFLYAFGSLLLFAADDGRRGSEPWTTDGTAAGTRFLRDVCPGACPSHPGVVATIGGRLLFSAFAAPSAQRQLWRTDGTSRGTVQVTSFERGFYTTPVGSVPGAVLFQAWDPEHGEELWRSNGTRPGTRLVEDIRSVDVGGSSPRGFRPAGSEVLFLADAPDPAGVVRAGLWRSDGTAAGTRPAGPIPECPLNTELNTVLPSGLLVFTCQHIEGMGLVSASGLQLLPPGVWLTNPREVVAAGNALFFGARDPEGDRELWTSDGASAARRVIDLAPGTGSDPTDLIAFQGRVLFVAWSEEPPGFELWSSNGTAEGTVRLTEGDVRPDVLGVHAGRVWFGAEDPAYGYELWSTDGTAAGTRVMGDVVPNDSFSPRRLISAGDKMFLSAGFSSDDRGLWVSDGTVAGTRRVGPYPLQEGFRVSGPDAAVVDGRLFYTAFLPEEGASEMLWQSDGTEDGTGPVLGSGVEGNGDRFRDPKHLYAFAGRLFFLGGGTLWSTDGTPEGASPVPDLQRIEEMAVAGSHLFLRAYDPDHGHELWALEP